MIDFNVTGAQVNAAMRHVYTAAGTLLTIGTLVAVVPQSDVQPILDALRQIGDGLQQIFGGFSKLSIILGPVIATIMAKIAASSASFKNQLKSVTTQASAPQNVEQKKEMVAAAASIPTVEKIVDPTIADQVPNPKVVAQ